MPAAPVSAVRDTSLPSDALHRASYKEYTATDMRTVTNKSISQVRTRLVLLLPGGKIGQLQVEDLAIHIWQIGQRLAGQACDCFLL